MATLDAKPGPHVNAILLHAHGSGYQLDVIYWARSVDDLKNGDTYEVTLSDASGNALSSFRRAVTYRELSPNGARCGPRCLIAELDAPDGG